MDGAISSYKVAGKKVRVMTPYAEPLIDIFRAMGGRFQNDAWSFPIERLGEVQGKIGLAQDDLVTVEVGMHDISEEGQCYLMGWHVLARRAGPDGGMRLTVHATLISGQISPQANKKTPRVGATADSRFQFMVPRDFAAARFLEIIDDPVAQAASAAASAGAGFRIDQEARIGDAVHYRGGELLGHISSWGDDGAASVRLAAGRRIACEIPGLQADHVAVPSLAFSRGDFTWLRKS